MASELLLPTARASDTDNNPYSGAVWYFYATGTTTPQAVYSDAYLQTTLGATVTADSAGRFAPIYFNSAQTYRGICKDSTGAVTLHDIDPINPLSATLNLFSGGPWLDDVVAVIADATLTYSAGASQVVAGDYVRTRAEGFSYEVADSAAVDHHVTTAGGVKLYVQAVDGGYNVKAFGAVGDGVTDDAAAIQAAITATATGEVLFPAGTYLIGAAGVNITSKTGVMLTGKAEIKFSAQVSQTVGTLSFAGIKFDSSTDCGIRGLRLNGNSIIQAQVGFRSCTNCIIDKCDVYGGAGATGQVIASGNTGLRVTDNIVRSGNGTATRGLWLGNTNAGDPETDILVRGNRVYSHTASGIVVLSTGGRIESNNSNNNAGSGIVLPGGGGGYSAKEMSIVGNTCNDNLFSGIQSDVVGYASDADLTQEITVSGNTCLRNDASGIYAVGSRGWVITGNTCTDNNHDATSSGAGIQGDDRTYDAVISGNVCSDTRSGASRTQDAGIRIIGQAASPRNIAVSGNTCYNNKTYGIQAQCNSTFTLTGVSITGNVCSSNGGTGIFMSETDANSLSNTVVSGNTCVSNTTIDLRISPRAIMFGNNRYDTHTSVNYVILTDNDTTPSVEGRKRWRVSNSGATSITNFDDGYEGQIIELLNFGTNTTLVNGGTIYLKGGVNAALPDQGTIALVLDAGKWREMWRNF